MAAARFRAFLNSPMGPKTTHFWGPVSNIGLLASAVADIKKTPDMISGNMTLALFGYSCSFMRFAWMVRPRNYMLLACHTCNAPIQFYQLSRWAKHHGYLELKKEEKEEDQVALKTLEVV
ncbi:hypothetical protein MKW92_030854 [Papaver armeniacum]|nr:hypothetical protein MKW92_030854 [Papaver armeniacum]